MSSLEELEPGYMTIAELAEKLGVSWAGLFRCLVMDGVITEDGEPTAYALEKGWMEYRETEEA